MLNTFTKSYKKKILIISGGTAGHIFPAITVAKQLIKMNWSVLWIGTKDKIESRIVPRNRIRIVYIYASTFRKKKIIQLITFIFKTLKSVIESIHIIRKYMPDVVFTTGSYISFPGSIAAKICKIPIILHEQNKIAGLSNKFLSKISSRTLQAFPETFKKANTVGNPIRYSIRKVDTPNVRFANRTGPLRVLIVGGSQGSKFLNEIMPMVFRKLKNYITVWHQTGEKHSTHKVYNQYRYYKCVPYKITDFIKNISKAYNWADLIICRSGAMTVSEITTVGLPAIFIPFKHKDNHQYLNAIPLAKIGAAKIFEQSKINHNDIVNTLLSWNRKILLKMSLKARSLCTINSEKPILNCIIKTSKHKI